jgi:hypothetical protein
MENKSASPTEVVITEVRISFQNMAELAVMWFIATAIVSAGFGMVIALGWLCLKALIPH